MGIGSFWWQRDFVSFALTTLISTRKIMQLTEMITAAQFILPDTTSTVNFIHLCLITKWRNIMYLFYTCYQYRKCSTVLLPNTYMYMHVECLLTFRVWPLESDYTHVGRLVRMWHSRKTRLNRMRPCKLIKNHVSHSISN